MDEMSYWWFLGTGLALIGLSVLLTALYWQRIVKRMLKSLRLEKMKRLVANSHATKKAQNKVEFVKDILYQVQALQVGFDSYLKLFTSHHDMAMQQEDWAEMNRFLNRRVEMLSSVLNGALLLMKYEDMSEVDLNDEVLVNEFCEDVFNSCLPHLAEGVDVSLETSLPDYTHIYTNMGCLDILLRFLILCSMEYTVKGHITLKVTREVVAKKLVFTINDTGLGIPDDTKNLVFDRLPYGNIRHKITGLRLCTCRALVRLLGGSIHVDPRYTEGTSIVFSISIKN